MTNNKISITKQQYNSYSLRVSNKSGSGRFIDGLTLSEIKDIEGLCKAVLEQEVNEFCKDLIKD